MPVITPQVTLDSVPSTNTQNADLIAIAQMLNAELATKVNSLSTDANTSSIENSNFVKEPLNLDQLQALEYFNKSSGDDIDIQKLQELELVLSMVDLQGAPSFSPQELYAIIILLAAMGF